MGTHSEKWSDVAPGCLLMYITWMSAILLGTMNYDIVHMLVLSYICAYIMILALTLLQYKQATPFPLILFTNNTYFNKETKFILFKQSSIVFPRGTQMERYLPLALHSEVKELSSVNSI